MDRTLRSLCRFGLLTGGLVSALVLAARPAQACGCFTPPDPSVPVVQAGERIVFHTDGGNVVAHIQIQYAGDAKEFGWLLPLPAVPVLELGTEELFTQLTSTTQPKYRLTATNNCGGGGLGGFNSSRGGASPASESDSQGAGMSPLVIRDSIGPYDYAVLKADDKKAMLDWLAANRFFVPAGTDEAVVPYIHPGGYFLALKLLSGKSTGDIQPIVVRYASDLPMIPIVLTSTAAQPDMGIQVWMLGKGRAIPRNYLHTVLNDAAIDWVNAGANYNNVVIRATREADGHHTFVTEYAGSSSVMKGVLDPPGRFGTQAELAANRDAVSFVRYLIDSNYATVTSGPFGIRAVAVQGTLLAILQAAIPFPAGLAATGVTPSEYYGRLDYYLGEYRDRSPSLFQGLSFTIDAPALAADIWKRVVTPIREAAKLFDAPYLTRLYTTLSPVDMNRDPVFSYNPDLPDVANVHDATITYDCSITGETVSATIVTEQGFRLRASGGAAVRPATGAPASLRIEILREQGEPQVQTDNLQAIRSLLGGNGCSVAPGATGRGGASALFLLGATLAGLRLGRRRRR